MDHLIWTRSMRDSICHRSSHHSTSSSQSQFDSFALRRRTAKWSRRGIASHLVDIIGWTKSRHRSCLALSPGSRTSKGNHRCCSTGEHGSTKIRETNLILFSGRKAIWMMWIANFHLLRHFPWAISSNDHQLNCIRWILRSLIKMVLSFFDH